MIRHALLKGVTITLPFYAKEHWLGRKLELRSGE